MRAHATGLGRGVLRGRKRYGETEDQGRLFLAVLHLYMHIDSEIFCWYLFVREGCVLRSLYENNKCAPVCFKPETYFRLLVCFETDQSRKQSQFTINIKSIFI